tara:strand:+ start:61 stop:546 length:486 start_codon:yes stop_codon:yes gene_type:complete
MGKILAQLEQMASSEYYEGTPDSYRAKGTEGSLMYSDPYEGLSDAEREMYGEDGITDDVEYELVKGTEAGYKKDVSSFLDTVKKGGIGDGPVPVKPISGRPPPEPGISSSRRGYRPTESPYGIPSELATQAEIQQEVARKLAQQFEHTVVKRPFLDLTGLV